MGMVEYDTMHAVVGQGMTMYRSADETIEQYYAAGVLTSIQGKFFGPQWSRASISGILRMPGISEHCHNFCLGLIPVGYTAGYVVAMSVIF